jgi:succinate dehydrogenase/fumarate reductase-like Fe-S protein
MEDPTLRTTRLTVRRHDPAAGGDHDETYEVSCSELSTVLDLLNAVRDRYDGTLAYRYACRVGKCGICAATVNGRPALTCMRRVGDAAELRVEAPGGQQILRDLVTLRPGP